MQAGFKSAKAFAIKHDIPQPTYAMHENGDRQILPPIAAKYAELLGISDAWILTGKGDGPQDTDPSGTDLTQINEIDVRATAGSGGIDSRMFEQPEQVIAQWRIPSDVLRAQTTAAHQSLCIIRVYGDSMEPLYRPGDRVLVDMSDRVPTPPGVFVLWDGLGTVLKRVEHIPYSDPPMLKLVSSNPDYETYSKTLGEVSINGRVIGKWHWT